MNRFPRTEVLTMTTKIIIAAAVFCTAAKLAIAKEPAITIHADQVLHAKSTYLTGACIEDVNHEIYGGIDSQMIFGESFAEPAMQLPLKRFTAFDGRWTLTD